MPSGVGTPDTSTTPATSTSTSSATTTATTTTASTNDPLNSLFGQLMTSMAQQQVGGQQNVLPPEQRYQIQLEQLASMGFHDRAANIEGMNVLCDCLSQI